MMWSPLVVAKTVEWGKNDYGEKPGQTWRALHSPGSVPDDATIIVIKTVIKANTHTYIHTHTYTLSFSRSPFPPRPLGNIGAGAEPPTA